MVSWDTSSFSSWRRLIFFPYKANYHIFYKESGCVLGDSPSKKAKCIRPINIDSMINEYNIIFKYYK